MLNITPDLIVSLVSPLAIIVGGIWWLSGKMREFELCLQRMEDTINSLVRHQSEDSDKIIELNYRVSTLEKEIKHYHRKGDDDET